MSGVTPHPPPPYLLAIVKIEKLYPIIVTSLYSWYSNFITNPLFLSLFLMRAHVSLLFIIPTEIDWNTTSCCGFVPSTPFSFLILISWSNVNDLFYKKNTLILTTYLIYFFSSRLNCVILLNCWLGTCRCAIKILLKHSWWYQ